MKDVWNGDHETNGGSGGWHVGEIGRNTEKYCATEECQMVMLRWICGVTREDNNDEERTHPRDNGRGACFQKDHGETTTSMWRGETKNTRWGRCWGRVHQEKGDDRKSDETRKVPNWVRARRRTGQQWEHMDDHLLNRRPKMTGPGEAMARKGEGRDEDNMIQSHIDISPTANRGCK